jgi:hypothetical protein
VYKCELDFDFVGTGNDGLDNDGAKSYNVELKMVELQGH